MKCDRGGDSPGGSADSARPPPLPPSRGRWFNRAGRFDGGFTLVEVLVALSIVAIALTAGTQATLSLTRNAERQSDVLLAHVCAENELVRARLSRQMPGVGDTRIDCGQAGRNFAVALSVRPTPNPNFRRIDAQAFSGDVPVLTLSTVLGQY